MTILSSKRFSHIHGSFITCSATLRALLVLGLTLGAAHVMAQVSAQSAPRPQLDEGSTEVKATYRVKFKGIAAGRFSYQRMHDATGKHVIQSLTQPNFLGRLFVNHSVHARSYLSHDPFTIPARFLRRDTQKPPRILKIRYDAEQQALLVNDNKHGARRLRLRKNWLICDPNTLFHLLPLYFVTHPEADSLRVLYVESKKTYAFVFQKTQQSPQRLTLTAEQGGDHIALEISTQHGGVVLKQVISIGGNRAELSLSQLALKGRKVPVSSLTAR